ncbi:hypothetical protein BDZ91DRAFT_726118 [Kalaharituber pfeilii]|nr:hypothetical protein BDZ91DRAFT_726118 [Kalaharituber pfeilii]
MRHTFCCSLGLWLGDPWDLVGEVRVGRHSSEQQLVCVSCEGLRGYGGVVVWYGAPLGLDRRVRGRERKGGWAGVGVAWLAGEFPMLRWVAVEE